MARESCLKVSAAGVDRRQAGDGDRRLLGGSWVAISRVISPRIRVISIITLLITQL